MKTIFQTILILSLIIACKYDKTKTDASQNPGIRNYDTVVFNPEHYKTRFELFSQMDVSNCKYLYLGNSITERGDWIELLSDTTIVNQGDRWRFNLWSS